MAIQNLKNGKKYYNCDKKGHFAKKCKQSIKKGWKPVLNVKYVKVVDKTVVIMKRVPSVVSFDKEYKR